ncbi:hypothetical protein [Oryza sativa Japonica Group]|uniref:Uncharacterized protein n=1 Tax=Oryza sativa subsp. japonica TaxID=39947 RepID=Q656Y5_ORYSJ|nr:hypothetical protein [Oryza sativa Japonica Group]
MGRCRSPGLELVAAEEMARMAAGRVEQGVGCGGAELAAEAGGAAMSAERVAGGVERRRRVIARQEGPLLPQSCATQHLPWMRRCGWGRTAGEKRCTGGEGRSCA